MPADEYASHHRLCGVPHTARGISNRAPAGLTRKTAVSGSDIGLPPLTSPTPVLGIGATMVGSFDYVSLVLYGCSDRRWHGPTSHDPVQ